MAAKPNPVDPQQLTSLIAEIRDLNRQSAKAIGTANALMERYARMAEEYEANRLRTEEIREVLDELVEEVGKWAQYIGMRMDRQEEWVILKGMGKGNSQRAMSITQEVGGEHLERKLREQLSSQMRQRQTYQRNLDRIKELVAKMGYENIENMNKRVEYEENIVTVDLELARLREALDKIEARKKDGI